LISYDLRNILRANGYPDAKGAVHAVNVDRHGIAWITDMDDHLILELDPRSGDSLDNAAATLSVHPLPPDFVPTATPVIKNGGNGMENQIGPHGIDTVVDDATGQTTIYLTV